MKHTYAALWIAALITIGMSSFIMAGSPREKILQDASLVIKKALSSVSISKDFKVVHEKLRKKRIDIEEKRLEEERMHEVNPRAHTHYKMICDLDALMQYFSEQPSLLWHGHDIDWVFEFIEGPHENLIQRRFKKTQVYQVFHSQVVAILLSKCQRARQWDSDDSEADVGSTPPQWPPFNSFPSFFSSAPLSPEQQMSLVMNSEQEGRKEDGVYVCEQPLPDSDDPLHVFEENSHEEIFVNQSLQDTATVEEEVCGERSKKQQSLFKHSSASPETCHVIKELAGSIGFIAFIYVGVDALVYGEKSHIADLWKWMKKMMKKETESRSVEKEPEALVMP